MALGKTGTGKTRTAVSLLPDAYFKSNAVVNGGRIMTARRLIIDDLRSATYPFLELLGMTDRYPYTIEDKGTIRQFKARRIIITCPRCPGENINGKPWKHR